MLYKQKLRNKDDAGYMILLYKIYPAVQFSIIFFTLKNYTARVLSTLANAEVSWAPAVPCLVYLSLEKGRLQGFNKMAGKGLFYKDM